jgi:hypothetical protein
MNASLRHEELSKKDHLKQKRTAENQRSKSWEETPRRRRSEHDPGYGLNYGEIGQLLQNEGAVAKIPQDGLGRSVCSIILVLLIDF